MLYIIVLLAIAFADPSDCTASQAYFKITKVNTYNANYQSHEITTTGGSQVYISAAYSNQETRTNDGCASSGSNHQYLLKLKSTVATQWYQGSYMTLYGLYDNIVFRGYRHSTSDEVYPLSLYVPIKKSMTEWKFTNSPGTGNGWIQAGFSDSSWTNVELGNTGSVTTSGTQFFRKTFAGLTGMAAYEVRFYYRYGILAYVNGVEAFRDNLGEGNIEHDAAATGGYSEADWRGAVRNANPIVSTSVLAIELHFTSSTTSIGLNAWLALYASSTLSTESTTPCYRFYYPFTITSESATYNPANAIDMNYGTYSYKYIPNSSYTPAEYYITFTGSVSINANGFEDFPYSYAAYQPKNYIVSGSKTTSSDYITIASVTGQQTYVNMVKSYGLYHFATANFKRWKISIASTSSTYIYFWEFAPCVCNLEYPTTLQFKPSSSTTHANIESIMMSPLYFGITGCTVSPALPDGVVLNGQTCTISGVPKQTQAATIYTVSASNGLNGTIAIAVNQCNGSGLELKRVYSYNSIYDTYVIKNEASTVMKEVTYNSGQVDQQTFTERVCWSGTRFQVTTGSYALGYWYYNSFLYISSIFGDVTEVVVRANYDTQLKIPNQFWVSVYRPVPFESQWLYKGGESSSTWYSMSTSGWTTATKGNFPDSSNRFQVYRKTFTVESTAMQTAGGFTLQLRYKYGTVIRMNSVEVFRNNVGTGDLSGLTAVAIYSTLMYRQISLPVKTMKIGEVASQTVLQSGNNEIAIAMISSGDSVKTSDFDCSLRVFGMNEVERIFDYTVSLTNIYNAGYSSYSDDAFIKMSFPYYYFQTCVDNAVTLTFTNDRKEWVSSTGIQSYYNLMDFQVGRYILEAKNPEDSTWVQLTSVSNLKWWIVGQKKKVYFLNNKPYNMFRWRNFYRTEPDKCEFRINQLYLWSDNTGVAIDTLAYAPTHEAYRDIEMAEIYPSSGANYRFNFTISPTLPTGLFIDPITGVLMGTATQKQSATTYTVSALDITGSSSVASLSITIVDCTGGKSLISCIIVPDSYYSQIGFKLFRGQDTTGSIVRQLAQMPSEMKYWVDECLPHDFYVFQVSDSSSDGWYWPSGFFITVDKDTIMLAYDHMPYTGATQVKNTRFSSYLPFELEFTEYKALMTVGSDIPSNWNTIDYTETAAWVAKNGPNFGKTESITIYIRRVFAISNVDDYPVMNCHVKYGGGVVAYFNGRRVARFNMPEKYTYLTEAPSAHDDSAFSKFHVIPKAEGAVKGSNVMAFELHRAVRTSSTNDIIFDATGVFGVEECNIVLNGYYNISGHTPDQFTLPELFDQNPQTYVYIGNVVNTEIYFFMENLERTRFNKYSLAANGGYSGYGWTLFGRHLEQDAWIDISTTANIELTDRTKIRFNSPIGMAGFKYYKWVLNTPGGYNIIGSEFTTDYCMPKGASICPPVDDYPAVAQGERSPSVCPVGYTGYAYRVCQGGTMSDEKMDECKMLPPHSMAYEKSSYILVRDTQVNIPAPSYENIIERFYVDPQNPLPPGLDVDMRDGKITGRPTTVVSQFIYKIYGKNDIATTHAEIVLSVKLGECEPSGDFKRTPVGEMAVFNCEMKGSYVGTQKRACLLGEKDGEWGPSSGFCISYLNIAILVILIIVILVVIIFVVVRSSTKSKKGGVKKGSSKKGSTKSSSQKQATKV